MPPELTPSVRGYSAIVLVVRTSSTCMHGSLSNKRMLCVFNTVKDEWCVVCLWNGLIGFSW
jgi:hypothetical protein